MANLLGSDLSQENREKSSIIPMLPLTKLHGFSFLAGATTVTPSNEFDSFTLAVLRGRLVRYLMRSREVTCKSISF